MTDNTPNTLNPPVHFDTGRGMVKVTKATWDAILAANAQIASDRERLGKQLSSERAARAVVEAERDRLRLAVRILRNDILCHDAETDCGWTFSIADADAALAPDTRGSDGRDVT